MTFASIIVGLSDGLKWTRDCWDHDEFIYLQEGSKLYHDDARNKFLREAAVSGPIDIMPHIDKMCKGGKVLIGWVPSQEDFFATDWYIPEEYDVLKLKRDKCGNCRSYRKVRKICEITERSVDSEDDACEEWS